MQSSIELIERLGQLQAEVERRREYMLAAAEQADEVAATLAKIFKGNLEASLGRKLRRKAYEGADGEMIVVLPGGPAVLEFHWSEGRSEWYVRVRRPPVFTPGAPKPGDEPLPETPLGGLFEGREEVGDDS